MPSSSTRTRVGIAAGVALALVVLLLPLPDAMSEAGRRTAAVPALMAGFMMPGGTAPNAMVFASGRLTVAQMVRSGVGLDVLGILVITLVFHSVGIPVFGIATGGAPSWAR